jgi:hypothetical protein
VKKKQVQNQGLPSQARRPLEESEFRTVQTLLREAPEHGNVTRYGVPALQNFQTHLISRIDCASQWQHCFFETHHIFPEFAGKARLAWSKNVSQEGEAPWQIVLGGRDPLFCVLIGLAVWLEYYLSQSQGLSPYVFDFSGDFTVPQGGDKTNSFVQRVLEKIFKSLDFIPEKDGPLGSHSTRKFASTRVRRAGATKDERDYRGRWKTDRRVSDAYDDCELPYPDAKVAGLVCVGGPCSYCIKSDSPVTEDWIIEHVVPSITSSDSYGLSVGKLLGKALLWVIFSEKSHWVPTYITERVKTAYKNLLGQESVENPIEKKLLVITGDGASLVINEVDNINSNQPPHVSAQQDNLTPAAITGGNLETQTSRQLLNTILHQVNGLQAQIANVADAREADKQIMLGQFRIVNTNLRRIASQPIRQLHRAAALSTEQQQQQQQDIGGGARGGTASIPLRSPADLSPTPRTLYELWQEYQVGIGGRKAARLFSAEERGRSKYKYSRRNVVWKLVAKLVNAGLTSQVACDRIYTVYGESTTITTIVNKLKEDLRNGTLHQDLQL